jgi:hypothetical protein
VQSESGKPELGIVALKEVSHDLLDGLPIADQRAISEIGGKPVRLLEYDTEGRAEIEFTDGEGVIHCIYLSADTIRTLTPEPSNLKSGLSRTRLSCCRSREDAGRGAIGQLAPKRAAQDRGRVQRDRRPGRDARCVPHPAR